MSPGRSVLPIAFVAAAAIGTSGCQNQPAAPSRSNTAPTVAGIDVSPTGLGLAGATSFSLSARSAQDVDGDVLNYVWNFGNGATGTGPTVTHVYGTIGTFTVTLTVSDTTSTSLAVTRTVEVGPNLTSGWRQTAASDRVNFPHTLLSVNVTQTGAALTGDLVPNVDFVPIGLVTFPLTGVTAQPLAHPLAVSFATPNQAISALNNATLSYAFQGMTTSDGSTMTGTLTQTRIDPPRDNPFRITICGSTEPVVTCPPVISTSVVTFGRR
jgi:PKD repeat protein